MYTSRESFPSGSGSEEKSRSRSKEVKSLSRKLA